jgi:hypothetical protein
MMKTIAAGTVALTLLGSAFALAQQAPPRDMQRWRPSTEDVAAITDARIAALKAGLRLSAEQEKNWPAIETAIRDLAKQRADRRAARREARRGGNDAQQAPDMIGRLRRGADAMTARAGSLAKFADAAEPLYRSLDDGQKRRFGLLLSVGGRPGQGRWHMHWQRRADNAR